MPAKGVSIQTPEMVDKILDQIVMGRSLVSILKSNDDYPVYSTFMKWITESKELSDKYARAKTEQADYLAEEIIDIADESANIRCDGHDNARVQAARVRVDSRKWIASKLKPKKYGEKVDLDVSGSMQMKHEITKVENKTDAELLEILANKKITRENSQP